MYGYIQRAAAQGIRRALDRAPVVALLGPRQCGKSTLAKHLMADRPSVYVDLQDRSDLSKLAEPELFCEVHRQELVCLDEIQRLPEFFAVLRSEVDRHRQPGRFLLLGSASRDLIAQSSESLAGRIAYVDLTPFRHEEISDRCSLYSHWLRGGFPDSVLALDDEASFDWRRDFIRTFLERDIPALGLTIPIPIMERLWRLLAHYHGQSINYSKLAEGVDISVPTLKRYLGILQQTYMVRLLPPAETNLKKRLVKAPKVYIRDSGILHALLDIEDYDSLLAHPVSGASWEGYVIEQLAAAYPRWTASFIRTGHGAEIDLLLQRGTRQVAIECKRSKAPKPGRGFHELLADMQIDLALVVAPIDAGFPISTTLSAATISEALSAMAKLEAR